MKKDCKLIAMLIFLSIGCKTAGMARVNSSPYIQHILAEAIKGINREMEGRPDATLEDKMRVAIWWYDYTFGDIGRFRKQEIENEFPGVFTADELEQLRRKYLDGVWNR